MERRIPQPEIGAEVMPFIPLDKSWLMRMGVLDILHGYDDTYQFLSTQTSPLSDDLEALKRASWQYLYGNPEEPVFVGESGTLYRFLQFATWDKGEKRDFIKVKSLEGRGICNEPGIVHLSLEQLLELDNSTSQWASAAVLLGNADSQPANTPYKLRLTYEAREHWLAARAAGRSWEPRLDATIARQAAAYMQLRTTGTMDFVPEQAEDYCFARAFDLITPTEGETRWSQLRGHESDRIVTMEHALVDDYIVTADHRVVQAAVMSRGLTKDNFQYPNCVNKSWVKFWDFIEYIDQL